MSDYNETVGVQLEDDFSKLVSELDVLLAKLNRLKSSLGLISNIKISSSGLSNMIKQLKKLTDINGIDIKIDSLNKALEKINSSNIKNLREELSRLKKRIWRLCFYA